MNDQMVDVILFAGVALFFAVQLWRVLGRRTGEDRPPQMPPTIRPVNRASPVVTPLPRPAAPQTVLQSQPVPVDPVRNGLDEIVKADPNFRVADFIAGARHAFEIIVQSFARGDVTTLKSLCSPEVSGTFESVIQQRTEAQQTAEATLERQEEPLIIDARLDGRIAFITVKFVTEQIAVTRAADGSVIDGDPERATEHTDIWTFTRDVRARDPNWLLVGTTAPV
jgi:predicted lipid-binding transport protein (Tim44 family)